MIASQLTDQVPFVAHVEVWTLMLGSLAIGWYTWKILQPKAVAAGFEPITRRQVMWYSAAMASMWIFSDWPIHDIAEQHLYFVHMTQHLFLSMIIPAMFMLATPRWMVELILTPGSAGWERLRWVARPVPAAVIYNALTVLLHWSVLVQLSADNGALHFGLHLMIFVSGLIMWIPVIGPIEEWRLSPPLQCVYLFVMSIVPTVPGGWLVFAEGVVYRTYDTPDRLWGIDVLSDQQAAGAIMKLVGGFFIWGVIFAIFVRWANQEMGADEDRRDAEAAERARIARDAKLDDDRDLTYNEVAQQFATTPPAADD